MKTKILITLLSLILLSSFVWADLNNDLFEAVKKGDKKKVAALIKKGANIEAKSDKMKKLLKKHGAKSGK